MANEIKYQLSLWQTAGTIALDRTGIANKQDEQTLIHLLFWFVHTKEGRQFIHKHENLKDDGSLDDDARKAFLELFAAYGVIDPALQEAIIDAHVAATKWVKAYNAPLSESQKKVLQLNEKIYLQKLSFITWCLWEDSKGREFSMIW